MQPQPCPYKVGLKGQLCLELLDLAVLVWQEYLHVRLYLGLYLDLQKVSDDTFSTRPTKKPKFCDADWPWLDKQNEPHKIDFCGVPRINSRTLRSLGASWIV